MRIQRAVCRLLLSLRRHDSLTGVILVCRKPPSNRYSVPSMLAQTCAQQATGSEKSRRRQTGAYEKFGQLVNSKSALKVL